VKELANLLPFVLIAAVFWFLIVRPQRRRQQQMSSTQSALGVGSEVMLGSGIFGTVASLDEETIQLELSPGTVVKVSRQAVVRVVEEADDLDDEDAEGQSPALPAVEDEHENDESWHADSGDQASDRPTSASE
jgi:preprotein translocase subunit YajC